EIKLEAQTTNSKSLGAFSLHFSMVALLGKVSKRETSSTNFNFASYLLRPTGNPEHPILIIIIPFRTAQSLRRKLHKLLVPLPARGGDRGGVKHPATWPLSCPLPSRGEEPEF